MFYYKNKGDNMVNWSYIWAYFFQWNIKTDIIDVMFFSIHNNSN